MSKPAIEYQSPLPASEGGRAPLPPIIWPLLALCLLLAFDFFFVPGFYKMWVRDGRLYGSLVDILNRGAPVMLLAMGMTLVIATGGVDLSVGSVMAICSAVAACLLSRPENSPLYAINLAPIAPMIVGILTIFIITGAFTGAGFGAVKLASARRPGAERPSALSYVLIGAGILALIWIAGLCLSNGIGPGLNSIYKPSAATACVVLAVAAAVVVGLLLGMWNGMLVTLLKLQPIIATLILMVAGRGIAQILTDSQKIEVRSDVFTSISRDAFPFIPRPILQLLHIDGASAGPMFCGLPRPLGIALLAFILMAMFTRLTAAGLFIESVGNNPSAARIAGVRSNMVKLLAYALTGLLAAVAGIIPTADLALADPPACGLNFELDAILAVVIGGTALTGGRFSLGGTIIGAILMQTLTTTVLNKGVNPNLTLVLKACVVIIVCLLQSPKFRKAVGISGRTA